MPITTAKLDLMRELRNLKKVTLHLNGDVCDVAD